MKRIILLFPLTFFIFFLSSGQAKTFKIASYNVENLFDLTKSGTEYPEYFPNTGYGWTGEILEIKITNIAKVMGDLEAEVILLQEVESKEVLLLLQGKLKSLGLEYPYFEISETKPTTVRCAILSTFPILKKQEIEINHKSIRNILKMTLDIEGRPFILFVNHWKSKQDPESLRIMCAQRLKQEIDQLDDNTDFILVGDFNSNYNEYETFKNTKKLNDTNGITGINHILKTIKGSQMVDEKILTTQAAHEYLYNLWLEVYPRRRWSHNFYGNKGSLDAFILPKALYDKKGISYVDNSFDKFDPDYLFMENKAVYRWQMANNGRGKHLGEGYSDHLPIFAYFSTDGFHFKDQSLPREEIVKKPGGSIIDTVRPPMTLKKVNISDLYLTKTGEVNYRLEYCSVIYKHVQNVIIKQKGGRAMFIYWAGQKLEYGKIYHLTVTRIDDYNGLREIKEITDVQEAGRANDPASFFLSKPYPDFSDPRLQNEVIAKAEGLYKDEYFHYDKDKKIKLYFQNKQLKPKNRSTILLKEVRIGYYGKPQLVIEKSEQIKVLKKCSIWPIGCSD